MIDSLYGRRREQPEGKQREIGLCAQLRRETAGGQQHNGPADRFLRLAHPQERDAGQPEAEPIEGPRQVEGYSAGPNRQNTGHGRRRQIDAGEEQRWEAGEEPMAPGGAASILPPHSDRRQDNQEFAHGKERRTERWRSGPPLRCIEDWDGLMKPAGHDGQGRQKQR